MHTAMIHSFIETWKPAINREKEYPFLWIVGQDKQEKSQYSWYFLECCLFSSVVDW